MTPLPLPQQLARILAAAALGTAALAGVRGVPHVGASAGAPGDTGACLAPEFPGFEVRYIKPEAAHGLLGQPGIAFVDCRTEADFEAGHVAGAVHIAAEAASLGPAVTQLAARSATVIAYCDAHSECEQSLRVANLLAQAGAHDVRVLEGGLPAWLAAGYPAQSGTCETCEAEP